MQAGYYQTSWSDIKNSPKWFGKLCLLALVSFIPIFGQIVVYGYAYGWARDIAWNIHAPMPERIFGNEDGKLYSRGFFAIVIGLVFAIPAIIFYSAYAVAASNGADFAGLLLMLLSIALAIGASFFSWVGIMRMSIYGRLSPGFQFKQIWKMIQHDPGGLGRILGMVILVGFVIGMIMSFLITLLVVIGGAGFFVSMAASGFDPQAFASSGEAVLSLIPSLGILSIFMVIASFFGQVATMFIHVLSSRALGYWTRQFEVPAWGGQDAPLPFETRAAAAAAAPTYGTQAQAQPYQQGGAPAGQAYAQPDATYQQPGVYGAPAQTQTQAQDYYQQPQAQPGQAPDWIAQASATAPQPQADPYSAGAAANAQPLAGQPVQTQPFSQAPAQQQAPAAQTASTDMHHKLEAKPAPRWEKIDLDNL